MRDLACEQQLLFESLQHPRMAGQFRPDDLQGDQPVQFAITRLVNRAHSAFAQQLNDLVTVGDEIAREQRLPANLPSRFDARPFRSDVASGPRDLFAGERSTALGTQDRSRGITLAAFVADDGCGRPHLSAPTLDVLG